MDFVKCLENVKQEYKTYNENENFFCIDSDIMLNDYDFVFVAVKKVDDKAIICDFANNLQYIKIDLQKVKKLCEKYNVIFDNFELTKIYNTNQDIENYLNCIKEIVK